MATDLEKLVVQLSADYKQYERAMQRASGVMNKQAREIEKRWSSTNKRLGAISSGMASSITAPLAGIGAALSIREVARYADAWTGARNALAVAGVTGKNQVSVLNQLYNSAQANAAPVTALASLYGKAAQANDNLGASQKDLVKFSDGVAVALRVAGTSAAQASGALTQLGQLLGSSRVYAEEFNSVNEGARPILIAVANGLDKAGGSVSKLKQMVNDGEVSGKQFFNAFIKGLPTIEKMAANATTTIDQGITKVQNAFTRYIGESDQSLGATQRLVQGLSALADNFEKTADITLKVAAIIGAGILGRSIGGMVKNLGLAGTAAKTFISSMRAATTLAGVGTALAGVSAAAAPIGAVIGVAAVGAMVAYSIASGRAKESTNLVNSEMERLGLVSPKAAKAVDQVSKAVSGIPDKAEALAALSDEIDRLKNGGGLSSLFPNAPVSGNISDISNLGSVDKLARQGQNRDGQSQYGFSGKDKATLQVIRQMVEQFRNMQISADDVSAKVAELSQADLSKPAKELLSVLGQVAQKTEAAMSLRLANDDLEDIDNAKAKIIDLRGELTMTKVAFGGWSAPLVKEVGEIIDSFTDGKTSAAEAKDALQKVADANPGAEGYIAKVTPILGVLEQIIDKANIAKVAMAIGGGGYAPDLGRFPNPYAKQEQDYKNSSYIKEQERLQGLTKDQKALEEEIIKIRKDAAKSGVVLTSEQEKALAEGNIAADKRRSGEGKKVKQSASEKAIERYDDSTLKDIAGMKAETAEIIKLTGEYDKYGLKQQRAAKEAELLQVLQNKGVSLTPQLREQVRGLADDWLTAAEANAKAKEKQDEFNQSVEEVKGSMQDAFTGLVTGAESFGDALSNILSKLAEMAASKAFEGLWSSGGGDAWLTSGLKGLGLYDTGGYTGPGGKKDPAGVVHKGEVVWSQDDIRKAGGVGVVEAMRRNGGSIPGYASGGVVDMPSIAMPASLRRASGSDGGGAIHVTVGVDPETGNLNAYVDQRATGISLQAVAQADVGFASRARDALAKPRRNY